jgi:drug/metabolite transporter (DMT)-like permease
LDTKLPRASTADTGPLAAFAVLALIWGYNWVVMKIAMRYAGPMDFAVLRVALGALLLIATMRAMRVPLKPRRITSTALLGALQTTGFIGLMSWAVAIGEAGKSAVLVYTMPFWVIVFGWPFLSERVRGRQWFAVALALAGLVLVLELWRGTAGLAPSLLALGAGAAWALSVIVVKRTQVQGRDALLSLTTWQMLFGFAPLAVAAWAVPERPIEWSGAFVAALTFTAIGGTAIAMLLWLYVLQRLSALVSGFSALTVPIVGVVAAWLQLGERPSLAEAAGMGLILAGLGLLLATGAKPEARGAGLYGPPGAA